jgi:hypothetical protein
VKNENSAMITTLLFIGFGAFALAILLYFARRRKAEIANYASLIERLERVSVGALLNLLDPAQQTYIGQALPSHRHVRLQRLRTRALLRYFWAIHKNAGIFLRCAHAATQSERPEIAEAGRELLQLAMFTRVQSLRALFLLTLALVVPAPLTNLIPIATKYATATSRSSDILAALARFSISA